MCCVWIWEQTAIISLYSINWLVFITETECVYCAVRAECSYIIRLSCTAVLCAVLALWKGRKQVFYDLLRQRTTSRIFKEHGFVSGFWKMKGKEWPGLEIAGFWEWTAWLLANNEYTSRVDCSWMHEWTIGIFAYRLDTEDSDMHLQPLMLVLSTFLGVLKWVGMCCEHSSWSCFAVCASEPYRRPSGAIASGRAVNKN
jgi:hypothetical protein